MIPYKTIISLNRRSKKPIYQQLANELISLIKKGTIATNTKLPSTRKLSEILSLHRKTIIAAYEELIMQNWIESIPKKGTFVHADIPVLVQKNYNYPTGNKTEKKESFQFYKQPNLVIRGQKQKDGYLYLNDGVNDTRLTPIQEIATLYKNITSSKYINKHIGYGTTYGSDELRETLVTYLNQTRGLQITKENILITRGSQMGIYLATQLLLKPKDKIAVGESNYISADETFTLNNAKIIRVKVDENGLDTNHLEKICKTNSLKALYITPHHHHPTTVMLSAERRIHLLNLAQKYNFAIMEDDYDYDFHYNHAPILPLASHDINGNVIYIGSICKTVAPVYRVGYLIATKEFVDEAAKLRTYVDRQGDALLEITFSRFIKNGDLDRHINKAVKIYRKRRNLCCKLLREELSEFLSFNIPPGGMAIWIQLNKKYNWNEISKIANENKLEIGNWKRYDALGVNHNSIRLGFAAYNEEEIYLLVKKLKTTFQKAKNVFKAI